MAVMKLHTFQFTQNKEWSDKLGKLDSENTLVLVFAAPEFIDYPEPIKELRQYYPRSKIIGCSSAGEIAGPLISDGTISVAVVEFEKTPIQVIAIPDTSADNSYQCGVEIAKKLDKPDLSGIFVLSEGLHINGSELVKGLNTIDKENVVITGGLAGDGSRFKQSWTIFAGDIVNDCVVAVGFYGNAIHIGHGSRGGWNIFGPERLITRSKNNILYELDGKPALPLYKEYLGEKASGLPATGLLFPLAIRKDTHDAKHLVRTILAIDEKEQSLTFAGDVPMKYLAQLMRANFDRLVIGANEASQLALDSLQIEAINASPILLIAISCVGRRLLLGERTEEETESVLEIFPQTTQQVGFYSYGEISPFATGNCDLHNQTMTLTSIVEEGCNTEILK
jgi:hypothetical protein